MKKVCFFLLVVCYTLNLSAQQSGGAVKRPVKNKSTQGTVISPSVNVGRLKAPTAPTPLDVKERTIEDLLYYVYACLDNIKTIDDAKNGLQSTFGSWERINGGV